MKNKSKIFIVIFFALMNSFSQSENYKKFFNIGNEYFESSFEESEYNYRIAINDSSSDSKASFNLSNNYYKMGLYDEAIARQIEAIKLSKTSNEKHKSYYNLGNLYMKKDMCSEAVNAYKNALRNDPKDEQTRYNLSIAKLCEENQNNEQANDEQQDEEQDNNDQQEQQDEQNSNRNEQQQDEQQSENEQQDKQDNKSNQNSESENQNKESDSKLSSQQIMNILKAMENAEKKVQAKINNQNKKGAKIVSEKDW